MSKTPYVGFGNDTLRKQPIMQIGDKLLCSKCGAVHVIRGGIDQETGKETDLLMFYTCGEKSYLAAVAGRSVLKTKSDCSGEVEI